MRSAQDLFAELNALDESILTLLYPETEKHPHQAYLTVPEDQKETGRET